MRQRSQKKPHTPAATQRTGWRWLGLGAVLGCLVALLVFAPAQWLAWGVQELSGGRILLEDTRGTLWHGSARVTLSGGPGTRVATSMPGRLDWRSGIHRQGLALQVQAPCCMAKPWAWQLAPRVGGFDLDLAATESQWPAALLSGLGTPWNTLQAQGLLQLRSAGLHLQWVAGRSQLSGRAQLDVLNVSSRLSTLQPMGSYRLDLQGGSNPTLVLSTLSGGLQLSGSGQWVGAQLRFRGEASAATGFEGVLSNLLNIIGRRQGARSIIQVG